MHITNGVLSSARERGADISEREICLKITWLGQAGLLFEREGLTVLIDPYLSDSVAKVNPANARRVPVQERFFEAEPDVLVFTHDHMDHFDPETAPVFLAPDRKPLAALCPGTTWQKARAHGGPHNYVLFDRGTVWTEKGVRFTAVKAAHSDPGAIGVVLEDLAEGKVYYVTGDTLFHRDIFAELPEKIDAVFLPVNGLGNNMNMEDARRFCEIIAPKAAVPMHCGLFDAIDMREFAYENKIVPKFFEEVELEK